MESCDVFLLRFDGSHINREAILYIGLEHSIVSLVNLLDRNNFNICSNVMFATKVEHFLRFRKTSYYRTRDAAALEQKSKTRYGVRFVWCTYNGYVSIAAK